MKTFLTVMFFLSGAALIAQEDSTKVNSESFETPADIFWKSAKGTSTGFGKNTLSGELMINPTVHWEAGLTYERLFKRMTTKSPFIVGIKAGFGAYENFGSDGYVISSHLMWISGFNSHHCEINLGAQYYTGGYARIPAAFDYHLGPSLSMGYRYQKPQKFSPVFRIGGGWPKAAYVSLGFSF
ncbi:hypothetical protein JYT72_02385 [Crocinitomix catalasitica]|nr:hypothetical protein [Crocinitomix catalasitica]